MLSCQIFRLPEEALFLNPYIKNNPKFTLVIDGPQRPKLQRMKIAAIKCPFTQYPPCVRCCVGHLTWVLFLLTLKMISGGSIVIQFYMSIEATTAQENTTGIERSQT